MSYLRFKLDLAIKQPLPEELETDLPEIKSKIMELKGYCENEYHMKYHVCMHDEKRLCREERNIE